MIGEGISKKSKHTFGLLYISSFVLSFHHFFVVYMNSSYISTIVGERYVGLVYIVGSILGIISLLFVSKILRRFGNYNTLVTVTIGEFLIFVSLAFFKSPYIIIPMFLLNGVALALILFNFDVFLEEYTKVESETGEIRGAFLTVANVALILAPLLSGLILTDGNYWKIYLISSMFLIPFLVLIRGFKNFKDPEYHDMQIKSTLLCISGRKNLFNIFMAQFLMRLFFSWMVIYMPIYLHTYIGFTWTEIGLMTALMLIPYVLIEYPAGKIADDYLGEKELLIAGFIITGISTYLLSFVLSGSFLVWTVMLLLTRAGASLIEIMTESYFFKHVDGSDNNTISFFRITRPFAYIIGPLLGTIALLFLDMQYIWIVLGAIVLLGLINASQIEDTR